MTTGEGDFDNRKGGRLVRDGLKEERFSEENDQEKTENRVWVFLKIFLMVGSFENIFENVGIVDISLFKIISSALGKEKHLLLRREPRQSACAAKPGWR